MRVAVKKLNDLAKLLDGNSNGNELDNDYNIDVEDICRKNKWVICFPYSDDCIEFRGYIDDELGAWDGGSYKFYKKGEFYPDEDNENTYHKTEYDEVKESNKHECDLIAKWCEERFDKETNKKYIKNLSYV